MCIRGRPPGPPPPAAPDAEPGLAAPQGEPYEGTAAEREQPSFATLVLSLSTQALMCLGEIPEAPGADPHQALGAPKSLSLIHT